MPEYLAPGVYVEEVSFRSKSIEGVSTTTTGFVGPTRYGPIDDEPELLTSLPISSGRTAIGSSLPASTDAEVADDAAPTRWMDQAPQRHVAGRAGLLRQRRRAAVRASGSTATSRSAPSRRTTTPGEPATTSGTAAARGVGRDGGARPGSSSTPAIPAPSAHAACASALQASPNAAHDRGRRRRSRASSGVRTATSCSSAQGSSRDASPRRTVRPPNGYRTRGRSSGGAGPRRLRREPGAVAELRPETIGGGLRAR